MRREKIFTAQDIKDFLLNSKLEPTVIDNLTVNKFLHICRIMYDANRDRGYYDYSDHLSDEQVYCRRKHIGAEETAWCWISRNEPAFSRDSVEDMEKILPCHFGYHFEELEFGGLCHSTGWDRKLCKGPIMSIRMSCWERDQEKRQRFMIAFNALVKEGIVPDIEDRKSYWNEAQRDLKEMTKGA